MNTKMLRSAIVPLLLLCSLFAFLSSVSFADVVGYYDFSDTTGLNLVGSAKKSGSALRLTNDLDQVGGFWAANSVNVSGNWQASFQFRIDRINEGADGIAFVIQNEANDSLGGGGSELGYTGITNSVAIELDTYHGDDSYDPDNNHIAVVTEGTAANDATDATAILGIVSSLNDDLLSFADGNIHTMLITYTPGTLTLYLDDMTTPILSTALTLTTELNLAGGTHAFIGFTGATGGVAEVADILNWSFYTTECNYSDNFDDNTLSVDWTYPKESWSESGQKLIGVPTGKKAVAIMKPGIADCQNCGTEITMSTPGGAFSKIWILGWYVDSRTYVEIVAVPDTGKWLIKQRIDKIVVAKAKGVKAIDSGVDYRIRISYDGNSVLLFVDDLTVPVARLRPVGTLQPGATGLQVKNTTGNFDDLCKN